MDIPSPFFLEMGSVPFCGSLPIFRKKGWDIPTSASQSYVYADLNQLLCKGMSGLEGPSTLYLCQETNFLAGRSFLR